MIEFVQSRFAALADPKKAREMAAYAKTAMPFYGINQPDREPVFRELKKRFPFEDQAQYRGAVLALWALPHREEKYAAIFIAQAWPQFVVPASLPLYRKLIVEGAWWDLVDFVAMRCLCPLWQNHRPRIGPIMDQWIAHRDMWLRRSAIIGQLKHKEETDEERLFGYCLLCAGEKEFFIRKAIGWALREYAKTSPAAVKRFIRQHREALSPLSFREASKHF